VHMAHYKFLYNTSVQAIVLYEPHNSMQSSLVRIYHILNIIFSSIIEVSMDLCAR
jgi:hypothetical protein